jgi:hypothetical protein
MKKAWIENNVVRDVCEGNPSELYHPDVAVHYSTDVSDDIKNGATLENGVWVNLPTSLGPQVKWITDVKVRNSLTLAERTKWDNNTTHTIITAKIEFAMPKIESDATEVLQFLVDSGDISQASMTKILA